MGDTPGVLYRCERKGFAGKGVCKTMKTQGKGIDGVRGGVCKLLKNKAESAGWESVLDFELGGVWPAARAAARPSDTPNGVHESCGNW